MDRELEIKQRIALGVAAALHARNLPFAETSRLWDKGWREHGGTEGSAPSLLTILAADYTADALDLRGLAILETVLGHPVLSVPWARTKAAPPNAED